jgi:hypothetical protein
MIAWAKDSLEEHSDRYEQAGEWMRRDAARGSNPTFPDDPWDGDRYVPVVHFAEEHQAMALEEWLRRERFEERPVPKFGPSKERGWGRSAAASRPHGLAG